MNFSPNEPSSSPSGMGTIRTMQGDLKNIRASKNKVQPQSPPPQPVPQAQPQIEQPKLQEKSQIPGVFSVSEKTIVKKVEKDKQDAFILKKKIADIRTQKTEQKTEKTVSETAPVEKIVKKEEKKLKPIIPKFVIQEKDKSMENENKKESLPKTSNSDKIQERIRMAQEKIRPVVMRKEVSAPENILAVSESENKAAIQYAASLSKSAQAVKNEEKSEKIAAIEEESEYLPPELRLYRNTGTRVPSFKKEPAPSLGVNNKPRAGTNQINDNILGKTNSFSPVKKTGKTLKFAVLILVIAIGVYFIFIQKIDLSFFLQWVPISPTSTPVLTVSPTPVAQDRIDIKDIIYIKDAENLNLELMNLKNQQNPSVSLVHYSINNTPVTGESLLNKLNITIPNNVKNSVDIDNVSLLYFGVNKRLGLAIGVKDEDRLTAEMKVWEGAVAGGEINPIPYTLSLLLLGNFFELNQNIVFSRGYYKEITINYANLPDSFRSVDYGIVKNFLIITTSKDDMFLVIDEVVK